MYGQLILVPSIRRNLLSVGQLTENPSHSLALKGAGCTILRNDQVIKTGKRGRYNVYRTKKIKNEEILQTTKRNPSDTYSTDGHSQREESYAKDIIPDELKKWYHRLGHLLPSGTKNFTKLGILNLKWNELQKPLNCIRCAQ